MIRTPAVPRPVRAGVAAASVVGVIALAGCAGTTAAESAQTTAAATPSATPAASTPAATAETPGATTAASASTYLDGTYTAEGTYVDGGGVAETVSVTITLANDLVTAVEVTGNAASPQSRQYQQAFIGGISSEVVGKDVDSLSVSRVAGSSLTSGGFNDALETIKAEAQA